MTFTAFVGHRRLATGSAAQIAQAIRERGAGEDGVLVFQDESGRQTDLDLRGSLEEIAERHAPQIAERQPGPGRPRLGVVSREVSLLPRHWEWLAAQRGGASATLRRLVDDARRRTGDDGRVAAARDAAYRFMHALAGDLPGFEEAIRALFASDLPGVERVIELWPADVSDYVRRLLAPIAGSEQAVDGGEGTG